jgi:hypothetical protein
MPHAVRLHARASHPSPPCIPTRSFALLAACVAVCGWTRSSCLRPANNNVDGLVGTGRALALGPWDFGQLTYNDAAATEATAVSGMAASICDTEEAFTPT